MKVLYIAHSGELQGAGIALLNIVKEIKNKGVEPIVYLPARGPMYDQLAKMEVKCYIKSYYNEIYPPLSSFRDIILYLLRLFRTLWCNYRAKQFLGLVICEEAPNIVHTNTGVISFGSCLAKKYEIPHVWHIREFQDRDFGYSPIGGINRVRKYCQDMNNNCIAITKEVFSYFNLSPQKDCVIYDGVFTKELCPNINLDKSNYFLFVGTLLESKGVVDAIRAFENIADEFESYELWLAGNENILISNIVLQSPFSDRIKLLGFRSDIYELMKRAKALLVPSYFEGFGFITTEAMLNGCLVIGRNTAGTKEQFDNGVKDSGNEIALRFDSLDELIEVMRSVCQNSIDPYLAMLQRAQETVYKLYTVEEHVENLICFYNKIVDEK